MHRVLILKELRETWWLAAAAFLFLMNSALNDFGVQILEGFSLVRWQPPSGANFIPFVSGELLEYIGLTVGTLGLALGFWQTVGEDVRGTWPFWLHRPVRREWMIGIKVVVGLVLVTAAGAIPILVSGLWFSRPGTRAAPFYWWQTGAAWQFAIVGPLLYLGAFYSGLRDAKWYGTRLLPLGAIALWLLFHIQFVWEAFPAVGFWVTTVFDLLLLAAILDAARARDFS
jgi:hypothetical protein